MGSWILDGSSFSGRGAVSLLRIAVTKWVMARVEVKRVVRRVARRVVKMMASVFVPVVLESKDLVAVASWRGSRGRLYGRSLVFDLHSGLLLPECPLTSH